MVISTSNFNVLILKSDVGQACAYRGTAIPPWIKSLDSATKQLVKGAIVMYKLTYKCYHSRNNHKLSPLTLK